jgi:hypothetical protein
VLFYAYDTIADIRETVASRVYGQNSFSSSDPCGSLSLGSIAAIAIHPRDDSLWVSFTRAKLLVGSLKFGFFQKAATSQARH